MRKEQIETIIWMFCIIVLLVLIVKVYTERDDFSCDSCIVKLENTLPTGETYPFGDFKIKDLFLELIDNKTCSIKWDPSQGYYYNNDGL